MTKSSPSPPNNEDEKPLDERLESNFATKPSISPAGDVNAPPVVGNRVEEPPSVSPVTYTFPELSKSIDSPPSNSSLPRNVVTILLVKSFDIFETTASRPPPLCVPSNGLPAVGYVEDPSPVM